MNDMQLTDDSSKLARDRADQQRIADIRFKQTLFGGIGGAMIFGLVSSVCLKLVPMAFEAVAGTAGLFSAAALGPIAGLAAVAIVGLGCVYFGSQLLSKVIGIEQEGQARKIQEAKSRVPSVNIPTLQPETGQTATSIPGQGTQGLIETNAADKPMTKIDAGSANLFDKHIARETLQVATNDNTWAERTAANDTTPPQTSRGA